MLEVEEPPKSSDLVSLTREELGLILEAQDIIPLSLRKKENQVFISLVDEYTTNSWNWLKLDKLFPFFVGILSVILIITGIFFPDFENIVLFCAGVVFFVFYCMVFGVVPICLLIKRKGFRIIFQNFREFSINICYYIFYHIYVIILGIVLGSLYVSWTKETYILISTAWDWCNLSKESLIPVISTAVISLWIWLVSAKKYLELTHKKWCNLSISSLLLAVLPSFTNTLYLVIHIVQYIENENLIAKGAVSADKLLELLKIQPFIWLKIHCLSIGLFIIMLYGIAIIYDFEVSKKYQSKYGSLFKKALFKNQK